MNRIRNIVLILLCFFSGDVCAQGKLVIQRFSDSADNAGKIKRIDFAQGFAIEYFYDRDGRTSKKKLIGFKQLQNTPCVPGPCEVTPDDPLFASAALQEGWLLNYKTIPNLVNAVFELNGNDPKKTLTDMSSIWKVISRIYFSNLPTDPKLTKAEADAVSKKRYADAISKFNEELNSKSSLLDQLRYLMNDIQPKMKAFQNPEFNKELDAPKPLYAEEKSDIAIHINNVNACSTSVSREMAQLLSEGKIRRERVVSKESLAMVQKWIREKNGDAVMPTQQAMQLVQDYKKILESKTAMAVNVTTYKGEPVIKITDSLMMFYPNDLWRVLNSYKATDRLNYFADTTFDPSMQFGAKYQHYFEWFLVHEFGHVVQQRSFERDAEAQTMFRVADYAYGLDEKNKMNILRPELKKMIKEKIVDQTVKMDEQSASYFALDNTACLN